MSEEMFHILRKHNKTCSNKPISFLILFLKANKQTPQMSVCKLNTVDVQQRWMTLGSGFHVSGLEEIRPSEVAVIPVLLLQLQLRVTEGFLVLSLVPEDSKSAGISPLMQVSPWHSAMHSTLSIFLFLFCVPKIVLEGSTGIISSHGECLHPSALHTLIFSFLQRSWLGR